MICDDCKGRADRRKKPGCNKDCGIAGCSCQHKAKHKAKDATTADPTDC